MKCEGGCGRETDGYELFDYCAVCSKNLCPTCLEKGCCGEVPARSGLSELDDDDYDGEASTSDSEKES